MKFNQIFTAVFIILLLASCASSLDTQGAKESKTNSGIKAQITQGNIGLQSVLDLGRSAYLKGCIDSKNVFIPEKASVFETCREMAKVYEDELKDILE